MNRNKNFSSSDLTAIRNTQMIYANRIVQNENPSKVKKFSKSASHDSSAATLAKVGAVVLNNTISNEDRLVFIKNIDTVRETPSIPTGITVVGGNAYVDISWLPSSGLNFPVLTYTIVSTPGGITSTTTGTSFRITGLTNGTTYTFTIIALNEVAQSPPSLPSAPVTPNITVPYSPTILSVSPGNASVTVTWGAVTGSVLTGGSPIISYTVTPSPAPLTAPYSYTGLITSYQFTNLSNGTSYTFTVYATNLAGNSLASASSDASIPFTVPDAPTGVSGLFKNSSVLVSWTPPFNQGSSIRSYTVTSSPGNFTTTNTGAAYATVTGLTNGTSYTFTVYATNAAGSGASSTASSAVIPATTPSVPTLISYTPGDMSAAISWNASTSTGGSAIISYTVTPSPAPLTGLLSYTALTTSYTFINLSNGTSYTFSVYATNIAGNSAASSVLSAIIPFRKPDAPTGVSGLSQNSSVRVSWTAPFNQGSTITNYTITSSPSAGNSPLTVDNVLSGTITGLTNGTSYTFTVYATNAAGNGSASTASSTVIPATVPIAPTLISDTPANAQVTLSWAALTGYLQTGGSAILLYTVTSGAFTQSVTGTTATFNGLTNGTPYIFTIYATNSVGNGAILTTYPVTPSTIPSQTTNVIGTAGNSQVTVSWTAPNNGGAAITGYTVITSYSGGSFTTNYNNTLTTATISGLTNGNSYQFAVYATNARGNGPTSVNSFPVTPSTVPGAPTAVTGVSGNSQVTVSWIAPVDNGGTTIISYTVTSGEFTKTVTGNPPLTTTIVTGLTNGTSYQFTVAATNSAGTGSASTASAAIVPATIPSAPTIISATSGNTQATISWNALTGYLQTGGAAIINYRLTSSPGGFTTTTTGTSATLSGLTNGTSYTFTLYATNSVGNGYVSTSSAVIPATVPDAPIGVTVVGLINNQIRISWTAPFNQGSAITGYTITSSPAGFSTTITGNPPSTTVTSSSLANGTPYTFTVYATNSIGNGSGTVSASIIAAVPPSAPTAVSATIVDIQATVIFTASSSTGGAPIVSYTATATPSLGGPVITGTGTTTPIYINGLPEITQTYTFTVVATNSADLTSAASTASAPVQANF